MNEFKDDKSNTLCILGAECFAGQYNYEEFTHGYDKVIIYNFEPLSCAYDTDLSYIESESTWITSKPCYEWLRLADEVWDYDENNIKVLKSIGIQASLHTLKPWKDWSQYAPVTKDIDILYIGGVYGRRKVLLNHLGQKYNIKIISMDNPIYGDALDDYILRSKLLLNVHGVANLQEQARMIRWIGAPCQIISEKSAHNYLGVPEKEYWELFLL
jgi:hypothetical protein